MISLNQDYLLWLIFWNEEGDAQSWESPVLLKQHTKTQTKTVTHKSSIMHLTTRHSSGNILYTKVYHNFGHFPFFSHIFLPITTAPVNNYTLKPLLIATVLVKESLQTSDIEAYFWQQSDLSLTIILLISIILLCFHLIFPSFPFSGPTHVFLPSFVLHSFLYLSGWTVVHWRRLALPCPLAPQLWPHASACGCRYNTASLHRPIRSTCQSFISHGYHSLFVVLCDRVDSGEEGTLVSVRAFWECH